MLASLGEKFDPHLAQAENLAALFTALHDEAFEIREMAMCTIGRLSSMNPAYVMPSLRKVLIQVTKKLVCLQGLVVWVVCSICGCLYSIFKERNSLERTVKLITGCGQIVMKEKLKKQMNV